jgi:hypothetical protein
MFSEIQKTMAGQDSRPTRQNMIDRTHALTLTRRSQLLNLARASVYYQLSDVCEIYFYSESTNPAVSQ